MNKDLLKKLVKEVLAEATESELKKLRRAVILSIFAAPMKEEYSDSTLPSSSSNPQIPSEIERDLNNAASSAPDADVRKISKVFLDQVIKDEEDLNKSVEYQKLKQDPEFQRLANNINQILKRDNKAGLLDMSNIAFTTSDISKPFSYSILLYHAVEKEAQALVNYLNDKYGKDFQKVLYKMLPRQSKPAIRPTKENLDELDQSTLINMATSKYPAEDFDKLMGTKLAKTYTYPVGYNEDVIRKTITNINPENTKFNDEVYQEKLDTTYTSLVQMNRSLLGNIKADTPQKKWNVVDRVISHINPNDIKFYVEVWNDGNVVKGDEYKDKIDELEKEFKVPIDWIPHPTNLDIIVKAISKKFNK